METGDEEKLDLVRQQLKKTTGQSSGLAALFTDVAGQFASEWIGQFVADRVKSDHATTLTLGPNRLREMKADVAAAQERAPAETKTAFAKLPWAFNGAHNPAKDQNYNSVPSQMAIRSKKQAPSSVDKPLRRVLGEAGRVLVKYGYKFDSWRSGPGFEYPNHLELSDSVENALKSAADADSRVVDLLRQVAELEKKIGQARAAAAWDEA